MAIMTIVTFWLLILFLSLTAKGVILGSKFGRIGTTTYFIFAIAMFLLSGNQFYYELGDLNFESVAIVKNNEKIKSDKNSIDINPQENKDYNQKELIIGDTDSKIYYIPGSTYYEKEKRKKVIMNTSKP